jgi:hypothetical protein
MTAKWGGAGGPKAVDGPNARRHFETARFRSTPAANAIMCGWR